MTYTIEGIRQTPDTTTEVTQLAAKLKHNLEAGQTLTQDIQYHSYILTVHVFRILAKHRRTEEEQLFTMDCDSDRFCNVVAQFNYIREGWAILESWEVDSYTDEVTTDDCF